MYPYVIGTRTSFGFTYIPATSMWDAAPKVAQYLDSQYNANILTDVVVYAVSEAKNGPDIRFELATAVGEFRADTTRLKSLTAQMESINRNAVQNERALRNAENAILQFERRLAKDIPDASRAVIELNLQEKRKALAAIDAKIASDDGNLVTAIKQEILSLRRKWNI